MSEKTVGSVMTRNVISVRADTPFKQVARLLADHGISGLPVVEEDGRVVGVISETDLMERQAAGGTPTESPRRTDLAQLTRSARRQAAKAEARTAGQLMTEPPVTVHADDTVVRAGRTMLTRHVERLPVVDEADRLVGIVTRRDLLGAFLRPDEEIRQEVMDEVLVRTLWLTPHAIDVSVDEGVVTLTGHLERRSEARIALAMARRLDGVVDVVDRLTHRLNDMRPRTG
ncbi:CBS domain-containing protein [Streptomyces sp. CG1]|uniref:CBS domain-containing protein n=1 Tax=Streptomyces sp. CG1 TaxID=1287523 RepID=UPI0034E24A82